MEDDTIGSAKINGIVGCGDILEITWPQLINHQERSSCAVHCTAIRVIDDNQLDVLDDTIQEVGKPVVRNSSREKWVRKD